MIAVRTLRSTRSSLELISFLLLAVAIFTLWIIPPVGAVIAILLAVSLSPLGRSFGERVAVTLIMISAVVAAVFTIFWVIKQPIPESLWRPLLTLYLAFVGYRIYQHPARTDSSTFSPWPKVALEDFVALFTGAVMFLMTGIPYMRASAEQILSATFWSGDHSSHLSIFTETFQSRGWFAQTGVYGDSPWQGYPRLHSALWSVGDWISGTASNASSDILLHHYYLWSSLSISLLAFLLVAASAAVARLLSSSKMRWPALVAASLTGIWCLLGSVSSFFDAGFLNFSLAAAFTISAVIFTSGSFDKFKELGWFTLPAATLVAAYLYTPLMLVPAVSYLAWLIYMLRAKQGPLLGSLVSWIILLPLLYPALRFVKVASDGVGVGTANGAFPHFEWPFSVLMIILVPVLILTSKALPGTSKASFTLPIVTLSGICVLFAFQAHSAQIPLEDSYYTKKILYSLFLYLVPLLVGIVAVAATRPFAHWPQDARKLAGLSTILVGSLLVAVTVSWTGGPAKSCAPTPGSYTPPGWWHTFCRQDTANTNKPILGTLALRVAESFDAGWAPYLVVDTKSRAAAGIISKVGSSLNPNYTDITVAVFSAHTAAELKKVMDENPKLKVRVILYYVSYPDMDKLAKELGSNRMQIQTIQN